MTLTLITLWLLLQLLVKITTPFKPEARFGHTATLIDNKLYILGGDNFTNQTNDFFYLDVSVSFNTQSLLWNDLSNITIVPTHSDATSVKGGANNNTLFLYGGQSHNTTKALIYTFDPQSNLWSIPNITGNAKFSLTGIVDHNGRMYLWSGFASILVYDMLILNTINLNWSGGSLNGAPVATQRYGATLLPNNKIIYIGGISSLGSNISFVGTDLLLDQVFIYDIVFDKWSTMATSGMVPSVRDSFSVVLGLDGQRVIIFGGNLANVNNNNITIPGPGDSLYELNLTSYEWTIPKTSGQTPGGRYYHKANVIEKYMVISFGKGYNQSIESDILLLDISNVNEYIWTNDFAIAGPSSSVQPQPDKLDKLSPAIIGAIVATVLSVTIGGFFLYRWNRNRRIQKLIQMNNDTSDTNIYIINNDTTNHKPIY